MAKRKTKATRKSKRKTKPHTIEPAWLPDTLAPLAPVILVPVPIVKTKDTMWQQFVKWLSQ